MSKRSEARLAAILLCVACALGAAEKKRKRPVIDVTRQIALLPPKPVSLPGVPIRQVDVRLPLPKASPAPGTACPRLFCNDGLTSRLPAAAPKDGWKIRWQAPVIPEFTPTAVVQDGDRVLAYGGGAWRLFDLDGKPLQDGRNGSSGMLDAGHGLFYFVNPDGFLAAHRLSDGNAEYNLNPAPGDAWPFIARRGNPSSTPPSICRSHIGRSRPIGLCCSTSTWTRRSKSTPSRSSPTSPRWRPCS